MSESHIYQIVHHLFNKLFYVINLYSFSLMIYDG